MTETILFAAEKIDLYQIADIYDSRTNPSGTIIPRPGSLVLDITNNGLLRRVVSVDEHTFNSTYGSVYTALLEPPTPSLDTDSNIVSMIDYGNSRFYLFYDKAENPTKLNVDKKVIVLGDDVSSYDIQRWDTTLRQFVPISLYYDTDGTYRGTKSPMATITTASNAKVPTNCSTSMPITDGDVLFMFIYDYAGTQCGSITLFAKQAIINNTLNDDLLIEDFTLESTQMNADGFYLFPGQDPESLVITPRLVMNDGTAKAIGIDDEICHLYGLEGFAAAYPGQSVQLLVKYFLAPTQQAVGPALVTSGTTRYLMRTANLVVTDPGTNEYTIKILTVPIYLQSVSRWTLAFFLYTLNSNTVINVTPNVSISPAFNGSLMGQAQTRTLSLRIRDIYPDALSDFRYTQPLRITLAPYSYYQRYTIQDSAGDTYGVYGVDSPILARPVLYYDATAAKYFIPTTKFSTLNSMLEAFYFKIRPLFDAGWLSVPITPTHFTVRSATSGAILLSAPIPVAGYTQGFAITDTVNPNQLVGTNCIVEFLYYANGSYRVLFGAPVDVTTGTLVD